MSRPSPTISPAISASDGYPTTEWNEQRAKYWEYWHHFDGTWLDEKTGDGELRFPIQMNPFNMTCLLHASFLFGEVRDGNDPLVTVVAEPWNSDGSGTASKLSELINRVWHESDGRSLQTENGIVSQVLGGCVFDVSYAPERVKKGLLPVRVSTMMPEYFFPVWGKTNSFDLIEAIIAFQINGKQAEQYGVKPTTAMPLYQEMWKRSEYEISIDGELTTWLGQKKAGKTPGGFVPYTYIPHIRVGEFYGISLLDRSLGMAQEINDRYADIGDTVAENARQLPMLSNVGKITVKRLDSGMVYVDLGKQGPGLEPPKVMWPGGNEANQASVNWAKELLVQSRVEKYTPPAVYGMDAGSQRSQLSLAISMIPLIAHIRQERAFFTSGLNQVARQIAILLAEKTNLVTIDEVSKVKFRQEWAPILPRDIEALVNEMILRVNAGLISPESAMDRLGDIRNIEAEMVLIKNWLEWKAQNTSPGKLDPFAGAGMNGTQAQRNDPKEPQANISKE